MITELFVLIFLIIFMFIPTLVARVRHIRHTTICFWINLLLGWSILFWLPLLAWTFLTTDIDTYKGLDT